MLRPHSINEHTKVNKAMELDIIINIGVVITPGKAKNIINGIMLSTNIISWYTAYFKYLCTLTNVSINIVTFATHIIIGIARFIAQLLYPNM